MNVEGSLPVRIIFERDTACYRLLYQKKKKASVQLSFDHFFEKVDKMLSAWKSVTFGTQLGVWRLEG